ncbi:MAG: bifunctional diaminohydroxyphosphoribosylaminopyrimidine deaminase/5-amino-6-(5-phosphoribosylamino)uracil reductase RibD [Pirellulaceae bacterium]|nr:bifunctional diaminohydroxyphosphoribosylaminopyrimidine deaminase/5-amino-6-(5-phosphoribosylamino)uracil reductase RibD [Pirellulaceae bacterium]
MTLYRQPQFDKFYMALALRLARRGEGSAEPNPMVGAVLVEESALGKQGIGSQNKEESLLSDANWRELKRLLDESQYDGFLELSNFLASEGESRSTLLGAIAGFGWHEKYGEAHAEVNAIKRLNTQRQFWSLTAYVTLEPCSHFGKTPPCAEALIKAGVRRVVIAQQDPYPEVSGQGIALLKKAGVEVEMGPLEKEANLLNGPYLKMVERGYPWVLAKWAMTLDGKIGTKTGESQWISNSLSREIVHEIRRRVDGVMIGSGTALADDPSLIPRPAGERVLSRIIVDHLAKIDLKSQLVQTALEVPTIIAVGKEADDNKCNVLRNSGCELVLTEGEGHLKRLDFLLKELARKKMTNLLVEGGGQLLGNLFDLGQVDEVHVFVGPKIFGSSLAPSPVAGIGVEKVMDTPQCYRGKSRLLGEDIYYRALINQG